MESFERLTTSHRHRRNSPSFSSSLLDAIYRSIDDSDAILTGRARDPSPKHKPQPKAVTRLSYSSAASISSGYYSGFSSDADSARLPRTKPTRASPILPQSDRIRPDPPPDPNTNSKKIPISIRKKLRELKKSTSPKLAGFINSIFTTSKHKKAKISTPAPPTESPSPIPSPSTFSYARRSCLSKTPSTTHGCKRTERTVRFCPVGVIVGEDRRPCGKKFVFPGEFAAAEQRKKAVEEMMRGVGMEVESGYESEDLFELEDLGGRFWRELPVYETTHLGMNRAIARGLVV